MEIQSYIGNFTPQAGLHERALRIFESLDIAESSRTDYKSRIWMFLEFIQSHPFNQNSFLESSATWRQEMTLPSRPSQNT